MTKSDQIDKLAEALSKAQGEMENAAKNANNPFYGSRYADLAEVLNTIRPALSSNGLALIQSPSTHFVDAGVIVTVESLLCHSSGQWQASEVSALLKPETTIKDGKSRVKDPDAQMIGKAITYLCRYAAKGVAMIAQEDDDDDGNAASGKREAEKPKTAPLAETKPTYANPEHDIPQDEPLKVTEPSEANLISTDALRDEIMRLVHGDKVKAKALLVEITRATKPNTDGTRFGGFESTRSMKHDWQVTSAWTRLLEHPVHGIRKPVTEETTDDQIAEIFGPYDDPARAQDGCGCFDGKWTGARR